MSPVLIVLYKVFLVTGFLSLTGWIVVYIRITRGGVFHDPLGRTLIAKSALIAALFVPTALSLFFSLNRATSSVVAWIDWALIALVTPVMIWRTVVWIRASRSNGRHHQEDR